VGVLGRRYGRMRCLWVTKATWTYIMTTIRRRSIVKLGPKEVKLVMIYPNLSTKGEGKEVI